MPLEPLNISLSLQNKLGLQLAKNCERIARHGQFYWHLPGFYAAVIATSRVIPDLDFVSLEQQSSAGPTRNVVLFGICKNGARVVFKAFTRYPGNGRQGGVSPQGEAITFLKMGGLPLTELLNHRWEVLQEGETLKSVEVQCITTRRFKGDSLDTVLQKYAHNPTVLRALNLAVEHFISKWIDRPVHHHRGDDFVETFTRQFRASKETLNRFNFPELKHDLAMVAYLRTRPKFLIHSDFVPSNLLINISGVIHKTPGSVIAIDPDQLVLGPSELDIARFIVRSERYDLIDKLPSLDKRTLYASIALEAHGHAGNVFMPYNTMLDDLQTNQYQKRVEEIKSFLARLPSHPFVDIAREEFAKIVAKPLDMSFITKQAEVSRRETERLLTISEQYAEKFHNYAVKEIQYQKEGVGRALL